MKEWGEKVKLSIEAINLAEFANIVDDIEKEARKLQEAINRLENFKLEITVKN